MFTRKDEPYKVARVAVGAAPWAAVSTYAFPPPRYGIATVGFGNNLDEQLELMSPATARAVAAALIAAADAAERVASSPAPVAVPSPLAGEGNSAVATTEAG